jgi:hypothetical protein
MLDIVILDGTRWQWALNFAGRANFVESKIIFSVLTR